MARISYLSDLPPLPKDQKKLASFMKGGVKRSSQVRITEEPWTKEERQEMLDKRAPPLSEEQIKEIKENWKHLYQN
jgi:hypothetical protein